METVAFMEHSATIVVLYQDCLMMKKFPNAVGRNHVIDLFNVHQNLTVEAVGLTGFDKLPKMVILAKNSDQK